MRWNRVLKDFWSMLRLHNKIWLKAKEKNMSKSKLSCRDSKNRWKARFKKIMKNYLNSILLNKIKILMKIKLTSAGLVYGLINLRHA
jgi:hypothetical protein